MLITLSPAKSLDWSPVDVTATPPEWQEDAVRLAKTMRGQTLRDLKSLMGLSDDLARLNRDRFKAFAADPEAETTRPAALAFAGDTYQGLKAADWSPDDLDWAQRRLCILSGLYGLLRPRDAIQPYRLEMGSRLKTRRGKTLYDYWGDQISKALNARAEQLGTRLLLNCASQEYFGAAGRKALRLDVITPQFLEVKDGRARMVSFFAKRARGTMARFMVQNRLTGASDVTAFDLDGYRYAPDLSEPDKPVFTRPYPAPAGKVAENQTQEAVA